MAAHNPLIEPHDSHCQQLLEQAGEQLDAGDRVQGAEKIWGAAAYKLAEIANCRGWPLESHADNRDILHYIAHRADDLSIIARFDSAELARWSVRRDDIGISDLRVRLGLVRELVDLLDAAHRDHDKLPPDLERPTDPQYRARHPKLIDPGVQREINIAVQEMSQLRKRIPDKRRQLAAVRAANAAMEAALEEANEAGS